MRKIQKMMALIIIVNMLAILVFGAFQNVTFAGTQKTSTDINGIDDKKYPGIKAMIQAVQEEHPNWNFKVLYTGLDWDDVINGENTGHGTSPKNLVPATNKYYNTGEWVCSICGTKKYDTGSWYCASDTAIEYMMDPRNSINSTDIFQFLQLSYVDCTATELKTMVTNYSYLNNTTILNSIISIGKQYNVNPYYIVARIIQEQGSGTSVLVTGAKYTGTDGVTYSGYYNAFNINASGNSTAEIYTNALSYAKKQGWTSLEKSIEGGITAIANNYIANGQDTMYFQKFNVSSTKYSYYTHQYMQNVLAAQSEGTILRSKLVSLGLLEENYTFVIPLYENMPSTACKVPDRNASSTSSGTTTTTTVTGTNNIKIDESAKTITTIPGITAKEVLGVFNSSSSVKSASNKEIGSSEKVGTEYTVDGYTLIVLGDVNGDGNVKATDYMKIKNYIMGTSSLTSAQKLAADANLDGSVKATDYMKIKNYIMGTSAITLN